MFIATVIVSALLALVLAGSAVAIWTRNKDVVATLDAVRVPHSWIPPLGAAKAAGAVGLVLGLFVPWIGIAAAIGAALYFAGAVIFHLRARHYELAPAGVILAMAAAALVLRVATA
ncbi:DoxX family protein [Streptomyces monticola]|uniref:DoxX family protein n=1 Tax=Streptomyces monticola TaxID=2666263 RepID=A0ABW2JSQ9_9ACTN